MASSDRNHPRRSRGRVRGRSRSVRATGRDRREQARSQSVPPLETPPESTADLPDALARPEPPLRPEPEPQPAGAKPPDSSQPGDTELGQRTAEYDDHPVTEPEKTQPAPRVLPTGENDDLSSDVVASEVDIEPADYRHPITRRSALGFGALVGLGIGSGAAPFIPLPSRDEEPTIDPRVALAGKKIIVIGAGLAGLTTARELSDAGASVRILEARKVLGGRAGIRTDKASGEVALGGEWMAGTEQNPIITHAKSLKVRDLDTETISTNYSRAIPTDITDEDQKKWISTEFERLDKAVVDAVQAFSQPVREEDQPGISLLDLAYNKTGVKSFVTDKDSVQDQTFNALVRVILSRRYEQPWGADSYQLAAGFMKDFQRVDDKQTRITSGFSNYLRALAGGSDITLECEVRKIYSLPGRAAGTIRVDGVKKSFDADAVVVTVPLPVINSGGIIFDPPLPTDQVEAMERIPTGSSSVSVFNFVERTWPQDLKLMHYMSLYPQKWADWEAREISGKPVLIARHNGLLATRVEVEPDRAADEGFDTLRSIFSDDLEKPLKVSTSSWSVDPYALGSHTYPGLHELPGDRNLAGKPTDNGIFFAGEAYHQALPGTLEGAHFSAFTVVDQLRTYFS